MNLCNKIAIVSLASFLVMLSGCAKKNDNPAAPVNKQTDNQQTQDAKKSNQSGAEAPATPASPQSEQQPQVNVEESGPFVLNQNYLGDVLTLIYPHPRNWGYVSISGDDAKALFDTLQIKISKSKGNLVWLPSNKKEGYNITCFEQARKDAPDKREYACSVYIEYRNGSVSQKVSNVKFDKEVPLLKSSYLGNNLKLIAPHNGKWGFISIKGKDARALYFTLDAQAVKGEGNLAWLPSNQKRGENIVCFEQTPKSAPEKVEYACSLYINYSIGAISPATN